MNPDKYREMPEDEFQRMTIESLTDRIDTVTSQIDDLDHIESEDDYTMFDSTERAGEFGNPNITKQEYFENEIKNLRAGLSIIADKETKELLSTKISNLLMKIDKVFKPEDFVIYSIDLIGHVAEHVDNLAYTPSESANVQILLKRLKEMVLSLNSSINTRGLKIDNQASDQVIAINKILKYFQVPEIATSKD